jgi:hypothetical protein
VHVAAASRVNEVMMDNSGPLSTDELATRATLLTIVAALQVESGTSGARFRLEPATEIVTYDTAVQALAMMSKPVACKAERRGDVVSVRCERLTDPIYVRMHAARQGEALASLRRLLARGDAQSSDRENQGPILLRGRHEGLLLPLAVIEAWERDYFLAFPRSITGNRADRAAKSQGAAAVLSIGPSRATSRDLQ